MNAAYIQNVREREINRLDSDIDRVFKRRIKGELSQHELSNVLHRKLTTIKYLEDTGNIVN